MSNLNKYFFSNIQMKRDKYWFSFSFSEALCIATDQREIKPVMCPFGVWWPSAKRVKHWIERSLI